MQIAEMKARPPHIRFITQAVEDRNASIKEGHPVFFNVDHVVLTPQGSKDSVTKVVDDWLTTSDAQVREERLPADWAEKFRSAYEHWKRGEEVPTEGTPLVMWPAISPAEVQACKSIHLLTVEDLAVSNDEAVRRLGMGGLELKKRAKRYLDASAGPGKMLAENQALRQELADTKARAAELESRFAQMEAKLGMTSPVKSEVHEDTIERKL